MTAYDAFISYSHTKDKPIAAALQSVIQKLAKPWYKRRALRLFRDAPSLWPSVEQALDNSRFLILLASPQAAASTWVNKEVAYWLDHKSPNTLMIGVTEGTLAWDNTLLDFASPEGMILPPALANRFVNEPKWVDLTGLRESTDARNEKFIEAGADFAAAIRGMPKEDLLSEEVRQQRRALRLAWSAAGTMAILISLAGWLWFQAESARRSAQRERDRALVAEQTSTEQKGVAQQQRDRAENAVRAATESANSMVLNLARDSRDRIGMPSELVRKILASAQALQRRLVDSGEDAPQLRQSEAAALQELSETLLRVGDTKDALAAAERLLAIMQQLVNANPDNGSWQRDLSAAMIKMGDVLLAAGRRTDALDAYNKSVKFHEQRIAGEPTNSTWRIGLSNTYDKIGDTYFAGGLDMRPTDSFYNKVLDLADALERGEASLEPYGKALEIREKLAQAEPDNRAWLRALSISFAKIADATQATNAGDQALKFYATSVGIIEKLAELEPSDKELQHSLSIALRKVGDILQKPGRFRRGREEAVDYYEGSVEILQKLVSFDPGYAVWQRDLSMSNERLSKALEWTGRRDDAIESYRTSVAIHEKLAAGDPQNPVYQRDLWFRYARIQRASGKRQ